MDPISIALICAASFGAVVALAAFIRMMMLSRDKHLNDEAQRRALTQETGELEKMRKQMLNSKRFDSHYKVLGANKDAIIYLDTKIDDILHKKTQLIERYAQVSIKESGAIVGGAASPIRKNACDRLKKEIDEEIKFYDSELKNLQKRRTTLWDTHTDLQEYLLGQEKARNESLDFIYKQHSGLLEKVYIRHIDNSEHIAKHSIEAGTSAFKSMVWAPIQFLLQYFNISTGVVIDRSQMENDARDDVENAENDVNDANGDKDTDKNTDEDKTDEENKGDDESGNKQEDDESGQENGSKLILA